MLLSINTHKSGVPFREVQMWRESNSLPTVEAVLMLAQYVIGTDAAMMRLVRKAHMAAKRRRHEESIVTDRPFDKAFYSQLSVCSAGWQTLRPWEGQDCGWSWRLPAKLPKRAARGEPTEERKKKKRLTNCPLCDHTSKDPAPHSQATQSTTATCLQTGDVAGVAGCCGHDRQLRRSCSGRPPVKHAAQQHGQQTSGNPKRCAD